jgi:anti-anti-sigma regulatory factor
MTADHTSVHNGPAALIAYELVEELNPKVVVIEFLSHTIADPTLAAQLGQQLGSLIRPDLPKQFVLDFTAVKTFSSTAFGALVSFILKVREAGGRVKICNMDEFVRFGADVIRMGEFSEFAADRKAAIEEFMK